MTSSSPQQDAQLLAFVASYTKTQGHAPALTNIARHMSVTVPTVKSRLDRLKREGKVMWSPGLARTIRVVR